MKVTTDSCLFGAWVTSSQKGSFSVMDIGTGSGLLSLLFAQNHPSALIDAIELDEDAFRQARENFLESPWQARLTAIHADVKTYSFDKGYDVILSNPPFYEKEIRTADSARNKAHHNEGLLLADLFRLIRDNLNSGGEFFLLLPFKRNEEIKKLFLAHSFHIEKMVLVKQTVNHPYFRIMVKGKLNNTDDGETDIEEMAVKDEKDVYTPEFVSLLGEFYLYL